MPRKYPKEELVIEKLTWAEKIVAKDPDFRDYAGANPEDGLRLAKIDFTIKILPKNHPFLPILKLARMYLIQKKKAFFCTVKMSEISQLGALKAGKPFDIRAKLDRYK